MSNERSPRPSLSMTMGTSGMSLRSFAFVVVQLVGCVWGRSVSCNPMVARDITIDGDPDEVWEALNNPELLAEWLSEDGAAADRGGRAPRRRRGGAGVRRGGRAVRATRAVALRGRRAGLAGRAAARGGSRRHARYGDRGPGRTVRPRGRVSSETDVFSALADPTRRTVLQEVATRGSATATELAAPLGITRQAAAKHR